MNNVNQRRGPGCFGLLIISALAVSALLNVLLFFTIGVVAGGDTRNFASKAPRFEERLFIESPSARGGEEDASAADSAKETKRANEKGRVALIDLRGLIASEISGEVGKTMVEDIEIALRQAVEDSRVKAILLQVESPGGEVTASDRVYHAIRMARQKKPVVVFLGSVAASGGFYTACAGNYLIANETTFTGSIGVIISTLNFESLLGKVGLAPIVFKSGKFKDILSGTRPMTDEERDLIQGIVMQAYEKFLQIVASERKLDPVTLRERIADGRILTGADALQAGLIDAVGQFEDAVAKARELGGVPDAAVHRYEAGLRLGSLFRALGESSTLRKTIRVDIGGSTGLQLHPGRLYYLPAMLGGI